MAEENGLASDMKMNEPTSSKSQEKEKQSGMNGGQEEPGKSKESEKTKAVPFLKLFSFADSSDIMLMIIGTIGAVGNGVSLPLMTILLGNMINSFGQNQDNHKTVDLVSKVKKNMMLLLKLTYYF